MIVEGPVRIIVSVREVEKHNIWMRPYLDKEGYELLYFGSRGWTPLIDCCCRERFQNDHLTCDDSAPIPSEDMDEECRDLFSETSSDRESKLTPCGCLNK